MNMADACLNFCKSTGLRILNGRTDLDKNIGKFTCVNSQGSSSIDFVTCRSDCFKYIKQFYVNEPNIVSDHCVVNFVLQAYVDIDSISLNSDDNLVDSHFMYVWKSENKMCLLVIYLMTMLHRSC